MSSYYGYADKCKVVGTNTVTLQRDARRIRQMFSKKYDEAESGQIQFTEHHGGTPTYSVQGDFSKKPEFKKDLRMAVSLDLS